MGMLRVAVRLVRRRQRTGTGLRIAAVLRRAPETQVTLLQMRVVALAGQRVRVRVCMRRTVNHLSYFRILVADVVGELGLLEAGGRHPLVAARRTDRRIGRIQAGLDQRLARLAGDHRLQFAGGERVHVPGLRRHQQHHLGTGQC